MKKPRQIWPEPDRARQLARAWKNAKKMNQYENGVCYAVDHAECGIESRILFREPGQTPERLQIACNRLNALQYFDIAFFCNTEALVSEKPEWMQNLFGLTKEPVNA